jgi:hypothetical protein
MRLLLDWVCKRRAITQIQWGFCMIAAPMSINRRDAEDAEKEKSETGFRIFRIDPNMFEQRIL